MDKLQEKIVEFGSYLSGVTNVGLSDNQKDMYYLLEHLIQEVQESMPKVPCRDKCSSCCMSYGLPRVTTVEWQLIHKYLIKEMDKETKEAVLAQLKEFHIPQITELMQEQQRIKASHTSITEENRMARPVFKSGHCPFLVNHSCSIYPVRPSICRAYGFFTIRVAGQSQLFTCRMAADQIMELLREKGVEHWALPVWDKYADKLYELNGDKPIATLPIWLMCHIDEKGEISMQMNRDPKFEELIEKFS